jgi:hypothetical protein
VPAINQIYTAYQDQGLQVISLGRQWNYPYSCTDWTTLGATYPLLDDDSTQVWSLFGPGYVPQNVILDHTMTVRYSLTGFNPEQTVQLIEQLLNELSTTGIRPSAELPTALHLSPPYPNPFNARTSVAFQIPTATTVTVTVLDLAGRQVARLTRRHFPSGRHALIWDATPLPSGLYIIRVETAATTRHQKALLVK